MNESNDAVGRREHRLEIRVQALKATLGLVDHYYLILNDLEYHPGMYARGCVLPKGTTKGYHVAAIRTICQTCYDKIILNFNTREDKRIWSFYPFINCESFSTGFSVQSLAIIAIPIAVALMYQKNYIYAFVVLLIGALAHLTVSKFSFSRTFKGKCAHLT